MRQTWDACEAETDGSRALSGGCETGFQCWFRRSHMGIIARVFVAVKGTGAIAQDLPVLTHPTADLFARS